MPDFYKQYVNDTLTTAQDNTSCYSLLKTLNHCHQAIRFTMEIVTNNKLIFLGIWMEIWKRGSAT